MDSKQNNDDIKKKKYYSLRYIYLIRVNLPTNNIFYIIMFILNYIGAIVCSRIPEMSKNSNLFSVNKILSNFLIFGKNFKLLQNNYQFCCIFGALILLLYSIFCLLCFFYMKAKYIKVSSLKDYKIQNIGKNRKIENTLFKFISYIFIIIIFFRQYILEYYFFAIYSFFIYGNREFRDSDSITNTNKYNENSYAQLYSYFSNCNYILCFIVNIFVIILVMIFFVVFMLLNSTKGLFLSHGCPFSDNKKYIAMKIILLSLQPFYGISVIFEGSIKIRIAIIFDALLIIFCLFSFYNCFHQFGFYPSLVTNICLFMELFIFVSSLSQLIIYFAWFNCNSNAFILMRLFIEIINTIVLTFLFIHINNNFNLNLFSKNIFSSNFKRISKGGFYYYMKIYKLYEKDKPKNYTEMFKIIKLHMKYCSKNDCPGKKLISKNISQSAYIPILLTKNDKNLIKTLNNDLNTSDSLKSVREEDICFNNCNNNEEENLKNKNSLKKCKSQQRTNSLIKENRKKTKLAFDPNPSIINEQNKLSDIQFQMIFEQEIINRIDFLNKRKNYYDMEGFIFIHLQYLLQIKKNYSLTLYYVGKYCSSGIKWSFFTRYFLYEYKKYLISIYYSKTNLANIDEAVNKYRKENHFLREVIYYLNFCSIVRHLIVCSCQNLKILFSLRKDLHNNIVLKSYQRIKTKNVLESAKNLQKYLKNIEIILKKHLIKFHIKLVSPELSYLLSNFYTFVMKKIPFDIKQCIEPKLDFGSIIDQLETGYKFFNLIHPFLLSLTKNDTFSIIYLSNLICAKLGYLSSELLNKDFHQKMFPGHKFIKEHELIMKQFLLSDVNSVQKTSTFLKTKDGYLVGVKVALKKLPSFFDDFLYIIDIGFIDDFYNSEINKRFNRYSFLLDETFNFMHMTRNFYDDFEFNVEMFKDIHMNFLNIFCVDQAKMSKKIKEYGKNNSILSKNNTEIINFIKKNDAFSVFKNINYENVFELRTMSRYEEIKFKPIIFQDIIDKNKIIKSLDIFSKLVEENGLDCDWYKHIDNFKQRLLVKDIIEEEDSNEDSVASSLIKKEIIRHSFVSNSTPSKNRNPNFFNPNVVVNIDRNFEVIYTLKRICNTRYSIVDLYEKTNYTDNENKHELIEDIDGEKNESQKFIIQTNTNYKKVIKNGRLTIRKYINPKTLSLMDDNVAYNNKSYNNNNININILPDDELEISKSKTHYNKGQNILPKIFIRSENDKKSIDKKAEMQKEDKKNNKIQKDEIELNKSLIDKEIEKSNIESDINKNNINVQVKTVNDFNRKEITNEIPNNNYLNTFNWRFDNNFLNINNKNNSNSNISISINNENSNICNSNLNNSIISKDAQINKDAQLIKERKNALKNSDIIELSEKYLINCFNSSNGNNNRRKQNNEDEEKISFIKRDELEDHIRNMNKKSKMYIILIIILFLLLFILPTVKLIILTTNFSTNKNLITLISSFEIIKMDLYSSAFILMGECANMTKRNGNANIQLENQNNIMSEHIETLLNQFQIINNNKNIDNIILYIYSNIDTFELNNDWTLKLKNSSNFIRELNYLKYIFKIVSFEDDIYAKCDLEKSYFQVFTRPGLEIYKDFGSPSETQKFLYYIMRNYMFSFKEKFTEIENEMCKAEIKILHNYFQCSLGISIFFCILLVLGEIAVLLKSQLDKKFSVKIFLYFYHYEKKQLQFEYEIYYLEQATKEFNIDNIYLLESIKKSGGYYLFVMNMAKSKIKNYSDKTINENKKIEDNKNNKSKNLNVSNKLSIDQNSMFSFLLNQSMASNDNSLAQFLNNKNNNNMNLNNNSNNNLNDLNLKNNNNSNNSFNINNNSLISMNNQKISEDQKMFKENEESIFIIKTNKKIIPSAIIISVVLPLIVTILFISFMIYSSIESNTSKNTWKYSFYLSMNYLQRIPKIMELGIFLYFFVISGNLTLFEFENKETHIAKMPIFMTYFTKLKGYDNSDLLSSDFINSYYTDILIDNLRIKKNIEFSLKNSKYKNHFTEYKSWNQKLNDEGYFCYNAAIGSIKLSKPPIPNISYFFGLVDDLAGNCYEGSEKIDETGLNIELNYIFQELSYAFVDFCSNENKVEARRKFYRNSDIKRIINDMNMPFQYAFNVLTFSAREDMINISESIIKNESFSITIIYALSVFIVFFVIMFIYFTEKDKKLLVFLAKILKKK